MVIQENLRNTTQDTLLDDIHIGVAQALILKLVGYKTPYIITKELTTISGAKRLANT